MSLALKLMLGLGAPSPNAYVDDLFAAYTRTGTGASQTVTTGLDLSTRGGLIISKGRSRATDWAWYDTQRGVTKDLADCYQQHRTHLGHARKGQYDQRNLR